MKNLRTEQAYIEKAAKLQAAGDAVKSIIKTIVKLVVILAVIGAVIFGCVIAKESYDQNQQFQRELSRTYQSSQGNGFSINVKTMRVIFTNADKSKAVFDIVQNPDNEREFKTKPDKNGIVWHIYVNNSVFVSLKGDDMIKKELKYMEDTNEYYKMANEQQKSEFRAAVTARLEKDEIFLPNLDSEVTEAF